MIARIHNYRHDSNPVGCDHRFKTRTGMLRLTPRQQECGILSKDRIGGRTDGLIHGEGSSGFSRDVFVVRGVAVKME